MLCICSYYVFALHVYTISRNSHFIHPFACCDYCVLPRHVTCYYCKLYLYNWDCCQKHVTYILKLYYSGRFWYSAARQINHIINIVKWPPQSFLHCVMLMSPEWMLSLKSYCFVGKWVIQLACEQCSGKISQGPSTSMYYFNTFGENIL